jgi:hypothetical protein
MKKRIIAVVSAFLITVLLLGIVSCGASGKASNDFAPEKDYFAGESIGSAAGTVNPDGSSTSSAGDGTKIIKTATVTAETKEYAKSTEALKSLIESAGGHISTSSASENASHRTNGRPEKHANYTIKVPSDKFDEFLSSLSSTFNVTNLTTSTEDVSESYFSLQARIETLESKREGLVSMLQHVNVNTDFTTWQKINEELTKIDTELMIYNEQLKSLENKVSYSTVTFSVSEVTEYTETDEKSYGDEIADAFKGSVEAVKKFFQGLLIVIIYLLPFLLISGVTAVVVVLIVRASVKKKKAKRNQNNDENK